MRRREVGSQPSSSQQPRDREIRQWITGALYVVYSLFHATGDTARDPNPKYFVGVLSRACTSLCAAGDALSVWRGTLGIHHHHHLPFSASTTMAGPWERCLRVLAHKSRLVSLKSVVRDIGRAYIKNRPRDERSPRIAATLPTFEDFSASSIITVVRCYRRECTEKWEMQL
ncbi:hypothetical protein K0M31_018586 [Melipona bicolor]|uniref:Uncharacterized protein n=1 Tax=Melipona bicolor TaxID=60889 RepID=A0AA40G4M5_9HYME|nr:hypothetical protein K0M31_018586 [Melipona bicolor]